MRKKSDIILRFCLIVGDAIMLVLSFAFAYFVRAHIDPRPYYFDVTMVEFVLSTLYVIPILIIILAALGLYKKSIFMGKNRFPEISRLFLAAILNISALITFSRMIISFRFAQSQFLLQRSALSSC